jgi:hypothetical protein
VNSSSSFDEATPYGRSGGGGGGGGGGRSVSPYAGPGGGGGAQARVSRPHREPEVVESTRHAILPGPSSFTRAVKSYTRQPQRTIIGTTPRGLLE